MLYVLVPPSEGKAIGVTPQLVKDLEERKLLDRTMIVLASEFSRDMMLEGRPDAVVKDQVQVPETIAGYWEVARGNLSRDPDWAKTRRRPPKRSNNFSLY